MKLFYESLGEDFALYHFPFPLKFVAPVMRFFFISEPRQTDGVSCKFTFFLFQMEEAALVRSSTVSGGSAGGAASSGFGGGGKSSKVGGRSSHKASKSHSFLSRDSHSGSSTSLSKAVKSGSSSAAAAAQNMIQKTGNSVRARLMKMSLHTDSSQC